MNGKQDRAQIFYMLTKKRKKKRKHEKGRIHSGGRFALVNPFSQSAYAFEPICNQVANVKK